MVDMKNNQPAEMLRELLMVFSRINSHDRLLVVTRGLQVP